MSKIARGCWDDYFGPFPMLFFYLLCTLQSFTHALSQLCGFIEKLQIVRFTETLNLRNK